MYTSTLNVIHIDEWMSMVGARSCRPLTLSPAKEQALRHGNCSVLSKHGVLCHADDTGAVFLHEAHEGEIAMVLRVGGPHPQSALFQRSAAGDPSSRRLWVAPFRLCLAGRYSVAAMLIARNPWGGDEGWFSRNFSTVCTSYARDEQPLLMHSFLFPGNAAVPGCMRCLWSWRGKDNPLATISLRQPLSRSEGLLQELESHLRYGLESRRAAADGREPAAWSHHEGPICLVGDSQTRQLANSLFAATGGRCDVEASQVSHRFCGEESEVEAAHRRRGGHSSSGGADAVRPAIAYFPLYFGRDELRRYRVAIGTCRVLLVNVGQWPLSFASTPGPWTHNGSTPAGGPWSLGRYDQAVREVLGWMLGVASARRTEAGGGMRLGWISTFPMPLDDGRWEHFRHRSLATCPPIDFRLPHLIAR